MSEQESFVSEMMTLAKISITDSEFNLETLLDQEVIEGTHKLLKDCVVEKVLLSSVLPLHQITQYPFGRERILRYVDNNRCFVDNVKNLIMREDEISKIAMGCMNNLSLERRFALEYSRNLEEVALFLVKKFTNHPRLFGGSPITKKQLPLLSSTLSTLANLDRHKEYRIRLQRNQIVWDAALKVLSEYTDSTAEELAGEIAYTELGLLFNVLADISDNAKKYATSLSYSLHDLLITRDSNLLQRALGVLRLFMTYSSEAVELVCKKETYKMLLDLIKQNPDDLTVSYAVKCIALCTTKNPHAREYVSENNVMVFYKILTFKNEITVGNAALILSSCFEEKEACKQFIGTSIVKDLLTITANEDLSGDVKYNVAIALAKLVKTDARYLQQLRELHGLEILRSIITSRGSP